MANKFKLVTVVVFALLICSADLYADYELPQNTLGYKMVLRSSVRMDNGQAYIGFMQEGNLKPPFVLIKTKAFDMISPQISSEVDGDRLYGKIILPANLSADDIRDLRINGYTILWKNIK